MCSKCNQLESKFHEAWLKNKETAAFEILPQYVIDNHRVDFAIIEGEVTIAVEIDSKEWHASKEQQKRDEERERVLRAKGWHFIRIYGPDCYWHPNSCSELTLSNIMHYISGRAMQRGSYDPSDLFLPSRRIMSTGPDIEVNGQVRKHNGLLFGLANTNIWVCFILIGALIQSFAQPQSVDVLGWRESLFAIITYLAIPFWTKWIAEFGKSIRGEK